MRSLPSDRSIVRVRSVDWIRVPELLFGTAMIILLKLKRNQVIKL